VGSKAKNCDLHHFASAHDASSCSAATILRDADAAGDGRIQNRVDQTLKRKRTTMSTISMPRAAGLAPEAVGQSKPGLLRRWVARCIGARSRSAERIAAIHLGRLSDELLTELGYSASEITALRSGKPISSILERRQLP
jgi:hypothetical protein